MPELPEVETTLRGIAPYLTGKTVRNLSITQPKLRWPIPESIQTLVGATVIGLHRRAKYLIAETNRGYLIIHLGMSGSLRVVTTAEQRRKHDHVEITLVGGVMIRFHDPRRFGAILWTTALPETHPLLSKLGPEPLAPEFNSQHLFAATRGKKVAIKNLVMDGHVVVGVGNIYANEALFAAGVRPGIAAGRVTKATCDQIVQSIKQVLGAAIEMGGTTLRDFVNSSGEPGYFQQALNVYGRGGEPCSQCSSLIKMRVIGQRSTFYCPACQH